MSFQPIYLLYGAVFLGAFLLLEGLFYLYVDTVGGRRGANRRMQMLARGVEAKEVFAMLRREKRKNKQHLGPLNSALQALERLITQSGATMSVGRLVRIVAALSMGLFVFLVFLGTRGSVVSVTPSALLIMAAISIGLGIGTPLAYLSFAKGRRLKKFGEQMPDALDMMVRSLRAGHPVNAAMSLVAQQMPDPIGTELGLAVDEMTYGLELREALANMGNRVGSQEFQYVVVAITIQHETGGNLAEVLGGLATVIRSRFRMFSKVKALSAEGRFSAKILGVMPFAFALMTFLGQPDYFLNVADDPLFIRIAAAALALEILGVLIMRKLINFKF